MYCSDFMSAAMKDADFNRGSPKFVPRFSSKLPHSKLQGELRVDETIAKDVADAKASW